MNERPRAELSAVEIIRRRIGQTAFLVVVAGLCSGIVLHVLRQGTAASTILGMVVGLLLILPIVNVLAVLAEEVRQRDWGFVGLAIAVLGLLTYAVVSKVAVALSSKGL